MESIASVFPPLLKVVLGGSITGGRDSAQGIGTRGLEGGEGGRERESASREWGAGGER